MNPFSLKRRKTLAAKLYTGRGHILRQRSGFSLKREKEFICLVLLCSEPPCRHRRREGGQGYGQRRTDEYQRRIVDPKERQQVSRRRQLHADQSGDPHVGTGEAGGHIAGHGDRRRQHAQQAEIEQELTIGIRALATKQGSWEHGLHTYRQGKSGLREIERLIAQNEENDQGSGELFTSEEVRAMISQFKDALFDHSKRGHTEFGRDTYSRVIERENQGAADREETPLRFKRARTVPDTGPGFSAAMNPQGPVPDFSPS